MIGVIEPLLSSAIGGIAVPIFEKLWKATSEQIKGAKKNVEESENQIKRNVDLKNGIQKYERNYFRRHGNLKILGMSKPIILGTIYTTVKVLDASLIKSYESVEALEKNYRNSHQRKLFRYKSPGQSGIETANRIPYLLVLGGPGIGKSTFLRRVGLEAFKGSQGQFNHSCIPVFLELKRFSIDDKSIQSRIVDEFMSCDFPQSEFFVKEALNEGKFIILFDGLDEVPNQNLTQVIIDIQKLIDRYPNNRFIISCRTAVYDGYFKRFTDVVITEFDDAQIKQFVCNWFQKELDLEMRISDTFWDLLNQPENASAKELGRTPLLLTFLCLVYDYSQSLPDNRSTLYRKALDILLEEWAAEKRIVKKYIYDGLHVDLEKLLLAEIAYTSFIKNQLFLTQDEIVKQISAFLKDTLDASIYSDGRSILREIESQQGVLVERAEDIYSFSHLTFHEYLVAQYIVEKNLIRETVNKHLLEPRWREVFLLSSGLLRGGAHQLLLEIENRIMLYATDKKLRQILNWAAETTAASNTFFQEKNQEKYKSAARRAVCIELICSIIDMTNNHRSLERDICSISSKMPTEIDAGIQQVRANAKSTIRALNRDIRAVILQVLKAIDIVGEHAIEIDISEFMEVDRYIDLAIHNLKALKKIDSFNLKSKQLDDKLNRAREKLPGKGALVKDWQRFIDALDQVWLDALNLDKSTVRFSDLEIEVLKGYLYANSLLLDCKKSAVRISSNSWKEIEERMFTIPITAG